MNETTKMIWNNEIRHVKIIVFILFLYFYLFSFQCKHKRSELLKHPVVISLVYDKWVKFGRGVFYGRFLLYAVFIFFLTGFVAIIPELIPLKGNGTLHCNKTALSGERSSARVIFFFFIGKYMVIMLSCLQLFLEVCYSFKILFVWVCI